MKSSLVVDVGNSRIKWGRCADPSPVADYASLPPDDAAAWQAQLDAWGLTGPLTWVVSGVHPRSRDELFHWLRRRGDTVRLLDGWRELPLSIRVDHPERVGIDRLLNAVAANARRRAGAGAVVVDAGSAVTVDWVDPDGAFAGGAIFPGLRLMAQALHEHTALLPLVKVRSAAPPLPGTSTPAAMEAGVFWAVAGGIRALIDQLAARLAIGTAPPDVFLTGGDGALLEAALEPAEPAASREPQLWPQMTLEGIRLAAEGLP
jgi:type III pantothenate kinase